jgi:peptidyl-prolyl cis-trans isomerase A (cyclophilin A)
LGTVELETATNTHARGAVALARGDDVNSGQSSFYFDLAANAHLNADPNAPPNTTGYAVFAHVTKGMEVLDAIAAVERAPEGGPFPGALPKTPIIVNSVRVE